MERIKLTKAALNDFIRWSTSRYNNYCGYGTKKENIDLVFTSLKNGCYTDYRGNRELDKKTFTVHCASSVGESGSGKYWKTKQGGGDYEVDCENRTIIERWSKREIGFLLPNSVMNDKPSVATEAQ